MESKPTGKSASRRGLHADPHYRGEKLYAIGGGRYVQYDGYGPLPEAIENFQQRAGRRPPFMLLPETPVDFYLSKGYAGARSVVHWPGEGPLPESVMNYVHTHGSLPATQPVGAEDEGPG